MIGLAWGGAGGGRSKQFALPSDRCVWWRHGTPAYGGVKKRCVSSLCPWAAEAPVQMLELFCDVSDSHVWLHRASVGEWSN